MKSVLISIRPKWCELIASGKKAIEVRKTKPRIETPFKCYIYCTYELINGKKFSSVLIARDTQKRYTANGKVIGEFVCDRILEIDCDSVAPFDYETKEYIDEEICFGRDELIKYAGFTRPFGWHISDLVIYDKPKELSEFQKSCRRNENCCTCNRLYNKKFDCIVGITRPP